MGLSLEEQETHLRWDRTEGIVHVYTSDRTTMTKFDKLCKEHPENYQCVGVDRAADNHEIVDKRYEIADKSLITFRGAKKTVGLTEEQRAELAERIKMNNPRFKASVVRADS